jgi:tetratricopeptide (TPR) repeat protein
MVEDLLPRARDIAYAEFLSPALLLGAECALARGDRERSLRLFREFEDSTRHSLEYRRLFLPVAVRILVEAGDEGEASRLVDQAGESRSRRLRLSVLSARAVVTEALGGHEEAAALYAEAAGEWAAYGFVLEEARTRLGHGRCRLALGDAASARPELERARELLEALGARPTIDEVDALLSASVPAAG